MIKIKLHPEQDFFIVKVDFERCISCGSPMIKLQEWGMVAQDLRSEGVQKVGSYQDEDGVLHTACQKCIDGGKVGCFECAICRQKRDHTLFGMQYGRHKLCKPCSGVRIGPEVIAQVASVEDEDEDEYGGSYDDW